MEKKRGNLSKAEREFIVAMANTLRPIDIAEKLNRAVDQVTTFIKSINPVTVQADPILIQERIKDNFKQTAAYRRLKEEFTKDELAFVEEQYISLSMQFKDDVLASEQQQILKAIKYEVLMSRNLKSRKQCVEQADKCRKVIEDLKKEWKLRDDEMDPEEYKQNISAAESDLMIAQASESQFTNEYVKFESQHQKLMEQLKATREQRVSKNDNTGKRDWLGLIRNLAKEQVLDAEKKQSELMKRAVDNETAKLAKPYNFNGEMERPLLTPESVMEDGD